MYLSFGLFGILLMYAYGDLHVVGVPVRYNGNMSSVVLHRLLGHGALQSSYATGCASSYLYPQVLLQFNSKPINLATIPRLVFV